MTTNGATRISCFAWRWCSSAVDWIWKGVAGVAALLYPPSCAECGAAASWGTVLCPMCAEGLPKPTRPACTICGEPLESESIDLCLRCGTRVRGFDAAVSLGPYDGGLRDLLQQFKFGREKAIGRWLAQELVRCHSAVLADVDLVTHVPMARPEERARGFNPSRFLARAVARRLGLREQPLLVKTRVTIPQRVLSARERERNLSGAFLAVRSGRGAVLLVDDLLTTGATADECAHTLKRAGFDRVTVATAARA